MGAQFANKTAERLYLESKLTYAKPGDEFSVSEMESFTGRKSGGGLTPGHAMFLSAAKFVERNTNGEIVWRWQRDRKKYRCLLDPEKPDDVRLRTKSMRRQAKRNTLIISGTDLSQLTARQQMHMQLEAVRCGLIDIMTNPRTTKQLESKVPQLQIPTVATLLEVMEKRS